LKLYLYYTESIIDKTSNVPSRPLSISTVNYVASLIVTELVLPRKINYTVRLSLKLP